MKTILDAKQINDTAMALASLRMPANEVVEALMTLDEFSLNTESINKVQLVIPAQEQIDQLE